MFINDIFNDKDKPLNEVSNELLGRYKKAAGADASAADKRGDVEQGNKRFRGIVKATIKQGNNDAKKHKEQGVAEGSMIDDLLDAPGKVLRTAQDAARGMPPGTVPDSQDDLVNTATKFGKQVIDTATDAARGMPTGTVPKPQKDKDVKEQTGMQYNPKGVPIKTAQPTPAPLNVPQGWEAKTQADGSTRISKQGSIPSDVYKQNMADYKAQNWTPEKITQHQDKMASGGYTDAERAANYQQQQKSFGQYADTPLDEQGVSEGAELKQAKRKYNQAAKDANTDQVGAGKKIDTMKNSLRQRDLNKQGFRESKKPDNYHIVNKDGKPASLASYADRASAEKDRDEKHQGAKVHRVGPRGKVKGVSESGLNRSSDHRKLGQELAHETNNIEISINGRVWKIFAGKGPDSSKEFFQQKQAVDSMCKRKTAETGKKWSWGVTGAAATNEGTKCNMTEQGRACPDHGIMECPGYSRLMGEAFKMPPESVQDKLHKRHQELRKKSGLPDPEHYLKLKKQKEQELVALRAEIAADKEKGLTEERYLEELQRAGYDVITEKKIRQRLDPKCWKGKHKEGTKIKGGVRVNNCVPNK